jgi:hypothetical protein
MTQIRIDTPKPRRRRPRHEVLPSIPATPTCFGRSPSRTRFVGAAAVVGSLGRELEMRTLELVDAKDVHRRQLTHLRAGRR